MANIKLTDNTWDTSGVWDVTEEKTQAEVNADVSELKTALNGISDMDYFPAPFTIAETGKKISAEDGTASTANTLSITNYIDVSTFAKIKYKRTGFASSSNTSGMAFYSDTNPESYISGVVAAGSQSSNTYQSALYEVGIPENAKYARFSLFTDTSTHGNFELYGTAKIVSAISELEDTVDTIEEIVENGLIKKSYSDPTTSNYSYYINSSNKWSISNRSCGIMAVPKWAKSVRILANASHTSAVAFLTSSAHSNNTTPSYATGWTNVVSIPANTSIEFEIPSDGNYLYYAKTFSDSVYTPQTIEWRKPVSVDEILNTQIPIGLHEMPPSQRELNIVKRCRQMTDIKWTPQADLPRYMLVQRDGAGNPDTIEGENYRGVFKAGVEYTGIPYGRTSQTMDDYGYSYATVGNYIDFETFITSVSNPNSKLCKEDVGSVAGHKSVIYATVCSGLCSYALNVSEVPTASIPSISGMNLIGKVNDNGTLLDDSKFKVGYILNKYDAHVAIITDIIRDEDGLIAFIELSDATTSGLADKNYKDGQFGGVCRRKGWTRDQLFTAGSWGDYSLYSYSGTVPYTPSKYVNVGDELNMQRTEHFPCMPYEGNKFVYKTGYIPDNAIKVLISPNLGYGYLKVFKDDVEITGSPFTVTNETASIDIEEISVGNYKAYLCNIESGDVINLTCSCNWSIVS